MICLESFSIGFGKRTVLNNFSLRLGKKERVMVIGNNGSGKTTLAFFLAGVIPNFISARVSGNVNISENVSLVMQNPSTQFISMTVQEELAGIKCGKFGVGHLFHKNVFELSEGEKQKINLVSNLLSNPDLLLLDEPIELLDPMEAKRFTGLISKISGPSIIWLDKADLKLRGFGKISLGGSKAKSFPKKRVSQIGKTVLDASFNFSQNGFFLDCPNLKLGAGEKVALIGYNGSGKTTVLKAVAGLLKTSGQIDRKMPVSFAPQNPSHLFFRNTVLEEVGCSENIETLGIRHLLLENPSTLSKGQQKLVSIASLKPGTIALFDEPTTWLDDANKSLVYEFINGSNQPMLIATHDRSLLDYCDRILMVEANKGVKECSSTAVNRFFQG